MKRKGKERDRLKERKEDRERRETIRYKGACMPLEKGKKG